MLRATAHSAYSLNLLKICLEHVGHDTKITTQNGFDKYFNLKIKRWAKISPTAVIVLRLSDESYSLNFIRESEPYGPR